MGKLSVCNARMPPVSKEVGDIRSALRGCRFLGIYRSVWLFIAFHGCALTVLLSAHTELSYRLSGVLTAPMTSSIMRRKP